MFHAYPLNENLYWNSTKKFHQRRCLESPSRECHDKIKYKKNIKQNILDLIKYRSAICNVYTKETLKKTWKVPDINYFLALLRELKEFLHFLSYDRDLVVVLKYSLSAAVWDGRHLILNNIPGYERDFRAIYKICS